MPKVYNKKDGNIPADAVYVGRPTKWGNPYIIGAGRDGTRKEVIRLYKILLDDNPEIKDAARQELRGKDLVCWCAPHKCHADVLMEIANA
jgi:hypothetical protein